MSLRLYNIQNIARAAIRSSSQINTSPVTCLKPISPKIIISRTSRLKFHTLTPILNEAKSKLKISKPDDLAKPLKQLPPLEPISPLQPLLRENIYTVPNILTATRIISAPAVGYFLVNQQSGIAMSIFVYSCITDFVDGYIARKFNMKSIIGSILDPMADKLLMTICTISLSYVSIMPFYLACLIIGRDVMLSFMAVYYRYVTLPQPKTFKRLIDISIPTVTVHPNLLSKVNTALQMVYIGSLVLQPGLEAIILNELVNPFHTFLHGFELLVATTTFLSGCTYIFSKNAVRLVKPAMHSKK